MNYLDFTLFIVNETLKIGFPLLPSFSSSATPMTMSAIRMYFVVRGEQKEPSPTGA